MAVFCKLCGKKFRNAFLMLLPSQRCICASNGFCKGGHILYEGSEKDEYTCKYCGKVYKSLELMLSPAERCIASAKGFAKWPHSPAL